MTERLAGKFIGVANSKNLYTLTIQNKEDDIKDISCDVAVLRKTMEKVDEEAYDGLFGRGVQVDVRLGKVVQVQFLDTW